MAQHAFWIIVDGTTPTSFRSRQRDDLLPTLTQLKRTQPQVSLMWFERGRLWPSPTEAREALGVQRKTRPGRSRDWRPGGEHVDPRAKYIKTRDEKRARFKSRLGRDRSEAPPPTSADPAAAPKPDRPFTRPPSRPPSRAYGGSDRPAWQKPSGDRPFSDRKPSSDRPFSGRKPSGDRPDFRRPAGDRPFSDRKPSGDRPPYRKPSGDRPFSSRPPHSRPPDGSGGYGRDRDSRSRDRDRVPLPPRPEGRSPEASNKPKPPRAFGDRPWRPKKPWRPGKPKSGSGSGS